ncbi:MAG: UDP-glucose/GDP-mannose dehydrogenase family protein [Desulfobacterales bacterium]|jgi:UDPglucose 6-dehydrogenase|nr:UDP-glucose/GDP-mannose dehydrogenase family protein [Desulfobacterales bacterium]
MNICIVGTGYVGLVTAACLAEMGNHVVCVDSNSAVVGGLKGGAVHIFEPGLESLVKRNVLEGRLDFSTDLKKGIEHALFIFNCVGTPSREDGACDLSQIQAVARHIGELISEYKIIVNKSTVPVGTADEVHRIISAETARRGLSIDFDVVSNPEFLKEGDAVNDFMKPDRIIVGTDNVRTAKLLEALYSPFARSRDKMVVMSPRSAEMTKYAANCMLATKISFINEIANICERVGADVSAVRRGIGADHRIGFHFIYPGMGFGGSCFPKDVKALINTAQAHGYAPELIAAVDAVNQRQKGALARKIEAFFGRQGGLAGRTLGLWGLAFKANTDDIRESPALELVRMLTAAGMRVKAFDPVAAGRTRAALRDNPLVEVSEQQYDAVAGADALAVATDWNQFRNPDFPRIRRLLKIPVVFDGRNLYDPDLVAGHGLAYVSIGRAAMSSGLPPESVLPLPDPTFRTEP